MKDKFKTSFLSLQSYCEKEHYKGWDPYDGLNSKVFQAIPYLHNSAIARLCVIQGFKRCPINLRKIALIDKEYNAKGIGLLLQGYCNLHQIVVMNPDFSNGLYSKETILNRINFLANLLIDIQSKGYSGACWGYNFDWQARRLFLFPKFTPTVVATTFCSTALMSAYEITKNENYLNIALSSANFVLNDLNRKDCNGGFLFSYSPLDGNNTVYNASLLGSKLLSHCYHYTNKEEYKTAAKQSVLACCNGQRSDGAWVYGMLPVQSWVDSFHTGYNLDGLIAYQELTGDMSFQNNINKGFDYYIHHFFNDDGIPKYYDNKQYPIDIHCPAQLLVTLHRLHQYDKNQNIANNVLTWTIDHMQDKKGYFYYQLKKGISSKISYMRWSNAFMFYAMSYYFLNNIKL